MRGTGCTVVVVCHVRHFAEADVNLSARVSCERGKLEFLESESCEEVHSIFLKLKSRSFPRHKPWIACHVLGHKSLIGHHLRKTAISQSVLITRMRDRLCRLSKYCVQKRE